MCKEMPVILDSKVVDKKRINANNRWGVGKALIQKNIQSNKRPTGISQQSICTPLLIKMKHCPILSCLKLTLKNEIFIILYSLQYKLPGNYILGTIQTFVFFCRWEWASHFSKGNFWNVSWPNVSGPPLGLPKEKLLCKNAEKCRTQWIEARVTRLGDFSPIGRLFTLGSFLQYRSIPNFGPLFPR
jgi:hypothetical protein